MKYLSYVIVLIFVGVIVWFGYLKVISLLPPDVVAAEAYPQRVEAERPINHSVFDMLLRAHVTNGRVDYAGLNEKEDKLRAYLDSIARVDPQEHRRNALLALYINAYNAATLKLILEYYPQINSIKDIPDDKRWSDPRWKIAGETVSLNNLEHEILRARFKEPRIHFALVCAAVGCPPLRAEAFIGGSIEEQLADQARRFHDDPRHFRWDPASNTVWLSSIYNWYEQDFKREGNSVLAFAARYCDPQTAKMLTQKPQDLNVKYLDYDWSLNAQ